MIRGRVRRGGVVRIITEDRQADNGGKNTWGSLRNGRMLTYSVYTTGLLIFPPNILLYSNLSNRENRDAHYNLSSKIRLATFCCSQPGYDTKDHML